MRFASTLIMLALIAATPASADWTRLSTKADLQKTVVGKGWINPRNKAWFRLNKNGKLSGAAGKAELTGAWAWKSGYLCFDRALGGKKVPSDCVVVLVNGQQIATVRNQGKGKRSVYVRRQ